jgi:hypothetical protein
MKPNFNLETLLPVCQRRSLEVENEIISFLPNAPSTDHKKIHEVRSSMSVTLMLDHMKDIIMLLPLYTNSKPPSNARRAIKK